MMRDDKQFISQTPLGPADYAAIAPIFGFTNADDMYQFAYEQQAKSEMRELLMDAEIPNEVSA